MQHEVESQWMGKMQFNSLVNGHTIIMDVPERVGGEDHGPIPKSFILTALSGCTGMDVVALMSKAQAPLGDLSIKVIGEVSKQTPIEYIAAHVIYDFKGEEGSKVNALDAVTRSQEKICGVSHMLKKIMPITWEVLYNGELLFSNQNVNQEALTH